MDKESFMRPSDIARVQEIKDDIRKGVEMSAIGQTCREKTWDERDSVEKIEKLRQVVMQQDSIIRSMCTNIDKLLTHQHIGDKLVTPIDHNEGRNRGFGYNPLA